MTERSTRLFLPEPTLDDMPPGQRLLLVPNQWRGSVEHFYHFLLGYLYPIVLTVQARHLPRITVRDCGPLTPWFRLLESDVEVEVIPAGHMLRRFAGDRQSAIVLKPYDDPVSFHGRFLAVFAEWTRERARAKVGDASRSVTVLDRRPGSDFYARGRSEAAGSGADRRSVPNLSDIRGALAARVPTRLLDTAGMKPADQVQALAASRVLVAQHGAGLSHMLWMAPGSLIVEIQPPSAPLPELFSRLAAALGHEHRTVAQAADHAAVDPAAVVAALQ